MWSRWCLRLSSFVAAAHQSHPLFLMRSVCSRAIFWRAHEGCTCSWRSFYSSRTSSVVGMYVEFEHVARDSPTWSLACNTDIGSIYCLPPRLIFHLFLKCKNLISNILWFSSSKTLTRITIASCHRLRLFFARCFIADIIGHLLLSLLDNLKCFLH